jgi:hypothetical protein
LYELHRKFRLPGRRHAPIEPCASVGWIRVPSDSDGRPVASVEETDLLPLETFVFAVGSFVFITLTHAIGQDCRIK